MCVSRTRHEPDVDFFSRVNLVVTVMLAHAIGSSARLQVAKGKRRGFPGACVGVERGIVNKQTGAGRTETARSALR